MSGGSMKKIAIVAILALIPAVVSAQTFFDQDFSGNFPPSGWSADSHGSNWHAGEGNEAGGQAPEAVFDWSPQFSGTSRFMSPRVDLTGVTNLKVEFKYSTDHYSGAYTLGVATRAGNGAWHNVWTLVNPPSSVPPTTVVATINNADVGAADFQICWFFSGSSYNINYWYLDDFKLFQPLEHDIRVKNIVMESQYEPGASIVPTAVVENFGTSNETFDVTCEISVGGNAEYSEQITGITLRPSADLTVEFPNYVAAAENELFEMSVTAILNGDMNEDNNNMIAYFNTYTTPRDMVLLEIGTGTWCQYCPGSAMGADDLIENGYEVAVIEYHNGDNYQNNFGMNRISYYGISGYPTAVFDGVIKFIGGSNNQSMFDYYLPIFQERDIINSAFTIDMFGENNGNDYDLTLVVDKVATIPWDNMVLHVALTESEIPESWYGQDHLNFVERTMMPNSSGTTLDFTSDDHLEIPLNFTFNNSWVYGNCELVAFIQNMDNKEILQGTKKALPDLTPLAVDDDYAELPLVTELKGNYPNPFNPSTAVNFSISAASDVTLEIFNVMGQKVKTLVKGSLDAGEHSVEWNGRDDSGNGVSSGVYFYKLTAGDYSKTSKMLMLK